MIRRIREKLGGRYHGDLSARMEAGLADVLSALGNVIDDDNALDRIYSRAGRPKPAVPQPEDSSSAAQAACDQISMLESAIVTALKGGPAMSSLATQYMATARRYLFELRRGLQARQLGVEDAWRLLSGILRALQEAGTILVYQEGLPSLPPAARAQIGELRQLNSDLIGQHETITDKVMKLFGHSEDPAPVLVPQH